MTETKYASWTDVLQFVGDLILFTLRWLGPPVALAALAFNYGWPILAAAFITWLAVKR